MRYLLTACLLFAFTSTVGAQQQPDAMTPAALSKLGDLMERDWSDRPEWAEMAVAILKGEGLGSGSGWFTGSKRRHDWNWLVATFAEAAADGRIGRKEIGQLDRDTFRQRLSGF